MGCDGSSPPAKNPSRRGGVADAWGVLEFEVDRARVNSDLRVIGIQSCVPVRATSIIRLETLADKFSLNTNAAKINATGRVANQIGVGSFQPEFGKLGSFDVSYRLLRFHEAIYNGSIRFANQGEAETV